MATTDSGPFRVQIKARGDDADSFAPLLHPGDGDFGATRYSVNLYGGNNTFPALNSGALGWKNPDVWDWKDASGIAQGSKPFASVAASSAHPDGTVYRLSSGALTMLVEEMRSGAKPNHGFLLRATGSVLPVLRSRQAATGKPRLVLSLTDSTRVTLEAKADVHLSKGSVGSSGASESLNLEHAASVWFDLSEIARRVSDATLELSVAHNYGSGSAMIEVYRVDLDHLHVTGSVEEGIAKAYVQDRELARHPSVYVLEHFPNLTSETSRGWTANPPNGDGVETSIVGAGDSDRAVLYQPLAPGVNALKTRIKAGSHGGTILRWYFHQNRGAEPDELYIRYYLRLANDWNPTELAGGGKLMAGFDGTYNKGNRRRKPNAPAYAGNGGRPSSSGCTGWSLRGGYAAAHPGNEISDAGYRVANFYGYFPTAHMLSRYEYGSAIHWNAGSYLQKNRWYCIEMYLKLNSIDTSGTTLAHFGNRLHIGVNQDTAWLYATADAKPTAPDTAIISAPRVYYGNKTGYLYPDARWTGPWITSDMGTDSAVLTSPGVGRHDAQLKVWIDGKLVMSLQNFLVRHIANVQIESVWLDQYAGGQSPDVVDTTLYVAQVVASAQYVGPMKMG